MNEQTKKQANKETNQRTHERTTKRIEVKDQFELFILHQLR
jgi:hypothetical protein